MSGVDGPGLAGSGVVTLDEGADLVATCEKGLEHLEARSLESLGAACFDIWEVEVDC